MNNLVLYAENVREIYDTLAWLGACVEKRVQKGQPVSVEHLANCSTMKKIVREAVRYGERYGERHTTAERKEAATILAEGIVCNIPVEVKTR